MIRSGKVVILAECLSILGKRKIKIGIERSKFHDNVLFKATRIWGRLLLRELPKIYFQKESELNQ